MRQELFKLPSKCLIISQICWFALVTNMWGFLATSHAPITANGNLSNKPYLWLVLLVNLTDLLRPVDSISIVLGFFPLSPLYPFQNGIPLGSLDDC